MQNNQLVQYIDMNLATPTQFTLLVTAHALSMLRDRVNICMNQIDSMGQFLRNDSRPLKLENRETTTHWYMLLSSCAHTYLKYYLIGYSEQFL